MSTKIRVGVFMGGRSIEREVSFNSGRTVCDHLDTQRFEIIPIYQVATGELYILPFKFLYRGKTSDFEHKLNQEAQKLTWEALPTIIDFMYIAAHGRYAEDGALQGFLEILKIPYLGSKVRASALSMNKIQQKKILRAHNISVPHGITVTPEEPITPAILTKITAAGLQFPVIVKPAHEGSSLGVSLVHDFTELNAAVKKACTIDPHLTQEVIIEEYITGIEFTCITLTNYTTGEPLSLPPTEIVSDTNSTIIDYEQKYMPGRSHKYTPPIHCSPEEIKLIQETCIHVNTILEICTISRIDGILTSDKKVVIFDPNTLSGMAPTSFVFRQAAAIGMNHTQIINHLINTELHYYGFNITK